MVVEAGATATASFTVPEHEHQITGRVLDSDGAPVEAAFVHAIPEPSTGTLPGRMLRNQGALDGAVLTDVDGRFTLTSLQDREHTVRSFVRGGGRAGQGRKDLGDIVIPTRRRIGGAPRGDWGFDVIRWNHDDDQLAQTAEVVRVREGTEAQRRGMVVGDVITAMDELDVTGNGRFILWFRMDAPVGATSVFELARGERMELRAG